MQCNLSSPLHRCHHTVNIKRSRPNWILLLFGKVTFIHHRLPPYRNHWAIWTCTLPYIEIWDHIPTENFSASLCQQSTAALLEADPCKLWLTDSTPPPLLHRLPLSVLPSWRLLIGRGQKSSVSHWSADAAVERRHHISRLNSSLWFSLSNTCIDPIETIFETKGLKVALQIYNL